MVYDITCLCCMLQRHKKLQDAKIGELVVENGEEEGDPNMEANLLTVTRSGNAALLEEILKAKLDPDIGDSKGRTPLVCVYRPFSNNTMITSSKTRRNESEKSNDSHRFLVSF